MQTVTALGSLGALLCFYFSPVYSTCYNLKGEDASQFNSENDTRELLECAGNDMCCYDTQQCVNDLKLCLGYYGLTREYCTDRDWPSNSCSQLCWGSPGERPEIGTKVVACGDGTYCCSYWGQIDDSEACCSEHRGFSMDDSGNKIGSTNSTSESISATAASSGTTDVSTSSTRSTSVTTSRTSQSVPTSSDTSARALESEALESPLVALETPSHGLSMGSRVGISVGSCVGGVLVAIGLVIYLRERSRRKRVELEIVQAEAREKPELDGQPARGHNLDPEMYLTPPSELDAYAYAQPREGLQNQQ